MHLLMLRMDSLARIIKFYREWRISGDTGMASPLVAEDPRKPGLLHHTWDPEHKG